MPVIEPLPASFLSVHCAGEQQKHTTLLLDGARSGRPDPDSPAIASAALGTEHERVPRRGGIGEAPELSWRPGSPPQLLRGSVLRES